MDDSGHPPPASVRAPPQANSGRHPAGGKGRRPSAVVQRPPLPPAAPTSWDAVAGWYDGWMGTAGSDHHRQVAVPALLALLAPQVGERILDVGCGQGVLAAPITEAGAHYTGVDASPHLLAAARRHGHPRRFLLGDARRLAALPDLHA